MRRRSDQARAQPPSASRAFPPPGRPASRRLCPTLVRRRRLKPTSGWCLCSGPRRVEEEAQPAVRPIEIVDECLVVDICIDEYLWALYERTPKVDTNKVTKQIK